MTATTRTLADFLVACVAEDEALFDMPDWFCTNSARGEGWGSRGECPLCGKYMFDGTEEATEVQMCEHFETAHRRTRVLAECESKRAIVEQFRPGRIVMQDSRGNRAQTDEMDDPRGVDVLRALASVYSDHPDFDPAWSVAAEFVVSPGRLHDLADVAVEFGVDLDGK